MLLLLLIIIIILLLLLLLLLLLCQTHSGCLSVVQEHRHFLKESVTFLKGFFFSKSDTLSELVACICGMELLRQHLIYNFIVNFVLFYFSAFVSCFSLVIFVCTSKRCCFRYWPFGFRRITSI